MGILDRLGAALAGEDPSLPPEARDELALALAYLERGDRDVARARIAALAARHPRAAAIHRALGRLADADGDTDAAIDAWGRAVDLGGREPEAWLGLGAALLGADRRQPAGDAFRRALALARDRGDEGLARAGRGRIALRDGDLPRAARELRLAAELLPEDASVAADLGRALIASGSNEGEQWLARAADDPRAPLAVILEAAGAQPRPDPAEQMLARAVARQDWDAAARAELRAARVARLVEQGRLDDARLEADAAERDSGGRTAGARARRYVAVASRDWAGARQALADETARGAAPSWAERLDVALGARDGQALAELAREPPPPALAEVATALRAFVGGSGFTEAEALALATAAPDDEARRYVAAALGPGEPPAGDLFGTLLYAHELALRTPALGAWAPTLAAAREAIDRPVRVAIMGEFNAGKSSFVNAVCGVEVAATGVTPTTATLNVLRHGPPSARVLLRDGHARALPVEAVAGALAALTGGEEGAAAVRAVEVFQPLDVLARIEIVDTPGLNALAAEHEAIARAFLDETDAIVWVFAAGQAAKQSERAALEAARAAGKRVLGVVNKCDQLEPEEVAAVLAHVRAALAGLVADVLPLSARRALAAARAHDAAATTASGLDDVLAGIDAHFVANAAELKRASALATLDRFLAGAAAAIGAGPATPPDDRASLEAAARRVRAALAEERLTLRERLEDELRKLAAELRAWLRPRNPLLPPEPDAAEEAFLLDLLDEAVARAVGPTRDRLRAALAGAPSVDVDAIVERFRAYARGALAAGGVARLLAVTLVDLRSDKEALARAFARAAPDPEPELLSPLTRAVDAAFASARTAARRSAATAAAARAIELERVHRPIGALADAVAALR